MATHNLTELILLYPKTNNRLTKGRPQVNFQGGYLKPYLRGDPRGPHPEIFKSENILVVNIVY